MNPVGPIKREVVLAMLFVGFALANKGAPLFEQVGRWLGMEVRWDMLAYIGAVIGSLAVTGLPILLLVWLVAKVWKAA